MSIRDESDVTPEPGRALFIFQRDNARVAEWTAISLWEITESAEKPRLVGLLHGTMKATWSVAPGEHDFMLSVQGRRQILRTRSDGDKTYFVELNYIKSRSDGPAGYSFYPVRAADDNPMTAMEVGYFNPSAAEWEERTLESATTHATKAYVQWDSYTDEKRARLSMLPEDGR